MSRARYAQASVIAAAAMVAIVCVDPLPRLVWNASASAPIGFYAVTPGRLPHGGDLVLYRPVPALANWLARRHYLPTGVPLLKHVGARAGQLVCRSGLTLSIDGHAVAIARVDDRARRRLPVWSGCHRLGSRDLFLLNPDVADSLDGRYFGVLPAEGLIGTAQPLWTRAQDHAPFRWHGWRP